MITIYTQMTYTLASRRLVARPFNMAGHLRATYAPVRFASNSAQNQRLELKHIGIMNEPIIPLSRAPWTNPKGLVKHFYRRMYAFVVNTFNVAQYRLKTKKKPRFTEWKNEAILNYIAVNKAFAARELDSVDDKMNTWVKKALVERSKTLPEDVKFQYGPIEFAKVPKVVNFTYLPLPNHAPGITLIVYRFDMTQKILRSQRRSDEVKTTTKKSTEYIGCVYDNSYSPPKCLLAGTVFESPMDIPLPDPDMSDERVVIQSMHDKGDIFREPKAIKA